MEVVGSTRVIVVMDDGREEESKDLQVREPVLFYAKLNIQIKSWQIYFTLSPVCEMIQ
jgi:hypothetical protein